MVSYNNVQYQKELTIQLWENLKTNGRTDGETDKDESDFIGRCSTNVECPTIQEKDKVLRVGKLY